MDKKLLILVGRKGLKNELFARLISERIGSDTEVVLDTFSNLTIEIVGSDVKVLIGETDIKEFGLVYFRRIDHALFPLSGTLALCLDKLGIKYFDTKFKEIGAGGDKLTSIVRLALDGISVPKTIFCPREKILKEKERIIAQLKFPFIAKDTKAQGNRGIFLLRKRENFEELIGSRGKRPNGSLVQFLFQEFVDIDREYRLLVLGHKVGIVHRKDKRNYKNLVVTYETPNLKTVFVDVKEIPDALKITAVKAARVLDVEIAGVDLCIEKTTGKEIVIEVNRGPGFEYDTVVSQEMSEVSKFLKNELFND